MCGVGGGGLRGVGGATRANQRPAFRTRGM